MVYVAPGGELLIVRRPSVPGTVAGLLHAIMRVARRLYRALSRPRPVDC
jgi:hypothetical protein